MEERFRLAPEPVPCTFRGVMSIAAPNSVLCLALFSPGMGEVLVVLVVALLLFGTKRLPGIARNLGRALEEFRRAARDVSQEVMQAADDLNPRDPPPQTAARGPRPEVTPASNENAEREPPELDDETPAPEEPTAS